MADRLRRRAALRRQREAFLVRMLAFSILAAIVGGGLTSYGTQTMLLAGRNNVTAYVPDTLLVDRPGSALVLVTDGRGAPLAGEPVRLEVAQGDRIVWSGDVVTDETGIATPAFDGLAETGGAVVTIRAAGEAMQRSVRIETTTRVFLQTDKPIYQPGQAIHIRTLTLSGTSPSVSTGDVVLEVSAPSGDRIFRKTLAPNEYGIAAYDYPLGPRLPLGLYKVKATVGLASVEKSIGVERYVLPRFLISFEGMQGWYPFGRTIAGQVQAMYTFGEPVQGTVLVSARTYAGEWTDLGISGGSLANGRVDFQLPATVAPADASQTGYVELKATVTDTAGHSETKTRNVPLSSTPILITALADANVPGAQSQYYVIARWPDGTPVAGGEVLYWLDGSPQTATTDARGVAAIPFSYNGQQTLEIRVSQGGMYGTLRQTLTSTAGVKVVADRARYEVGDVARFSVYFAGESFTDWVYYELVARGFVVTTGRLRLEGNAATFSYPVDRSLVPLAEVRAYKTLKDLTVSRDVLAFPVGTLSELQVDIAANRTVYRPGDDVTLDFRVSDGARPVAAALGVSILDIAVYEVDERFRGLEDALKGAEGAVPYATQVVEYVLGERAVPPDQSATTVVSPEDALAATMHSTLPLREREAALAQDRAVNVYWSGLILAGLAGYLGIVVVGVRNRKYAAWAVALTFAIPGAIGLAQLGTGQFAFFTTGLLAGGGPRPGGLGGLDSDVPAAQTGGGIGWFNLGGTETAAVLDTGSLYIRSPPRVRSFFPETWYWNPTLITDGNGTASIALTAPDSITTWDVTAIASTRDAKFGSGNGTVRVFQEFFVEPDVPVAAVQNDTFDLAVSVFNYLGAAQDVAVQLLDDGWFVRTGPSQRMLTVPPNTVDSVAFTITATEIGAHNLTVLGGNAQISDAVVRLVRVDPRGAPVEETFSGRLAATETKAVTLVPRDDRIPGTEAAFVRIQPSMNAVVLDGAENYIQYVSGCGEQSMSTLNIDVLAFRLVSEGTSDAKMLELERIVTQGIQHELTFLVAAKNGQGRGIVWFPGDRDAHPWLTSWGLITIQDARDAGFDVDERILTDMQAWLVSIQNADGSWQFPEWGIYEFNNPLLRTKTVSATAYIARALLYSGVPADTPAIHRALQYVSANVRDLWDDPYTLALSLIVLADARGDSALRSDVANRLVALKTVDNGTVYWRSPSSLLSDGPARAYRGGYDSRTSETTGYAVMALNKERGVTSDVAGGIEYLLQHRNPFGGFVSTQDTVVAFQALIAVGTGSAADNLDVTVRVNGTPVGSVLFDQSVEDLTYLLDLTPYLTAATTVELSATGAGSVSYQVVLSQFLPWGAAPPCTLCFDLTWSARSAAVGQRVTVGARIAYDGDAPQLKMVLVTIASGAGLRFDVEALDALVESGTISLYEFGAGFVRLYVQNVVRGTPVQFDVVLVAYTPFDGTIQGCRAEDLYDPSVVSTVPPLAMTVTP